MRTEGDAHDVEIVERERALLLDALVPARLRVLVPPVREVDEHLAGEPAVARAVARRVQQLRRRGPARGRLPHRPEETTVAPCR